MPPQITLLDGASVIGGTKILIQNGQASALCDFGTNFAVWNRYFEEYLKPRDSYGFVDVAAIGLLPFLPNLYRDDLVPSSTLIKWRREAPPLLHDTTIEGLVVSHAHLDHCGYVSFLKRELPVHCGLTTALLMKAIQDQGRTSIEGDICFLVPRTEKDGLLAAGHWKTVPSIQRKFVVPPGTDVSSAAASFWAQSLGGRGMVPEPLRPANRLAGMEVRLFPVDHSIPGAAAAAFETEAGWVVYTGDIRMHGAGQRDTEEFIRQAAELRPTVLLCEGTRATRGDELTPTEEEVADSIRRAVREAEGLVIADFGSRNVERLQTFRHAAEECNRQLIIMVKDAHLLRAAHLAGARVTDPLTDPVVGVYQEPRVKESAASRFVYEQFRNKLMSAGDVRREQGQCILCFSYWDVNELIEIEAIPNSLYIYSSSEAYTEEKCGDVRRLRAWLEHFEIRSAGIPDPDTGKPVEDERGFHASGHAPATDLARIIESIAPRKLVPVHTESPEWFVENFGNRFEVVLPREFVPIPL